MAQNKTKAAEELGLALLALRKRAGLTVRQLAGRLGSVSPGNISNWSNGRLVPLDRLIQILDEFEVRGDERERLMGLRRQADGPGELSLPTRDIPPQLTQLIDYESAARRITSWELGYIPGLLQTREYATAILSHFKNMDTRLDLRMRRQNILTRDHDPVDYLALIDSSVLERPVASKDAMVAQLRHLLVMAERPNVEIRIVPITTPGRHPGLLGPFLVIEFPRARPVVHIEHYKALVFLWDTEPVSWYTAAHEELRQRALNPDDTFETIEARLKEMEQA